MWIALFDLESVLIPELWPVLAKETGNKDFLLTTRDIADKKELNRLRLKAIKEEKLSARDIEKIISRVSPLKGAAEFVSWLRERMPLIIVSDCFRPLAQPVLKKIGMPAIIAHEWKTKNGKIVELPLRMEGDTKAPVVKAFQSLGYKVLAVGDSLNDLGMLKAADAASWFCPSERALKKAPRIPVSKNYGELKTKISVLLAK